MRQVCPITFRDVLAATDLLAEYAAECPNPELGEICPQPQIYELLEKAGVAQMFGAFVDGQLVGFASILMTILPHYGKRTATQESLFLAGAHRAGGLGSNLLDAMEDHARNSGCIVLYYSALVGSRYEKVLSRRKGCRKTNSIFCKRLI